MRRALLFAGALLAGCSSGQDPGVPVTAGDGSPSTTSHLLERCPPGGPDATTAPEGCLDEQGALVKP